MSEFCGLLQAAPGERAVRMDMDPPISVSLENLDNTVGFLIAVKRATHDGFMEFQNVFRTLHDEMARALNVELHKGRSGFGMVDAELIQRDKVDFNEVRIFPEFTVVG